ncbi:MAG TPA: hypothetical protein GX507_04975 [Clostridia bacterium]|nr:hypothetical protein [Clostridia bacterium]
MGSKAVAYARHSSDSQRKVIVDRVDPAMALIIDRFESNWAILEWDGKTFSLPRAPSHIVR